MKSKIATLVSLTLAIITPSAFAEDEAKAQKQPNAEYAVDKTFGEIEPVAQFHGPMPTGVTVSATGRIFVNFPRWGDKVDFTVAEIDRAGKAKAYPNEEINQLDPKFPATHLLCVQSVVMDPRDRLWILDTGSPKFEPVIEGGAKMVCVDLNTNKPVKTIIIPKEVALSTSYLNDVRFDLTKGKDGVAYITDSSQKGPNSIIVVDLDSGESRRRLSDHLSTKAEKGFLPIVEGRPLMIRLKDGKTLPFSVGTDGIAISADGSRLFYCPLSSRHLYSVATSALLDKTMDDSKVAQTVIDEGLKGPSDGLESDAKGNVYLSDFEHNAILIRTPDGAIAPFAHDPRMLWPDTLSLAQDGYLYFTANQIHRSPSFNGGKDLREKPYGLFRIKVDAAPVLLTR